MFIFLSLFFCRMLNKVKLEVDIFGITAEDLDFLDQVVSQLQKFLVVGLFQVNVYNLSSFVHFPLFTGIYCFGWFTCTTPTVSLTRFILSQRLLQSESPLHATLEQVRCNKKFIDICSSCIHDALSEILPRLGKEHFFINLFFMGYEKFFSKCLKILNYSICLDILFLYFFAILL